MKAFLTATLFLFCLVSAIGVLGCGSPDTQKAKQLKDALKFEELPDVAWVEYGQFDVFVAFHRPPKDMKVLLQGAAVEGRKVTGNNVTVWACRAANGKPSEGAAWRYWAFAEAQTNGNVKYEVATD